MKPDGTNSFSTANEDTSLPKVLKLLGQQILLALR